MTSINTVNHGGTQVYSGMQSKFDEAMELKQQISDQRDAIESSNMSPADKQAALEQLDRAEAAIADALDFTTKSSALDNNSNSLTGDGDMSAVLQSLSSAHDALDDALQISASGSQTPDVGAPPAANNAAGPSASGGAASAAGSGGATSSSGDDFKSVSDMDPQKMLDLMSTNPEKFMEELSSLRPEDRAAFMQTIQTQLQQINQLFSTMSNFAKSQHDTNKAVINNLRV